MVMRVESTSVVDPQMREVLRDRIDAMVLELLPVMQRHFPEQVMITDTSYARMSLRTKQPVIMVSMVVNL